MHKGEVLVMQTKRLLFTTCIKLRKHLNLNFSHSFYFDKAYFELKAGNIFGLTDLMLDKYEESQLKKKSDEPKEGLDSFREHIPAQRDLRFESPIRSRADT